MAAVKAVTSPASHPTSAGRRRRFWLTSGTGHELPALDGLRALAILLVMWHHLYLFGMTQGVDPEPAVVQYLAGFGFSGVFLFFILSGFLLFLPYARALVAGRAWPSARHFYRRRALRILPAYYVALLLLVLVHGAALLRPGEVVSLLLMALLGHDMQWQAFLLVNQLDLPFWTLAVEWQFYLLLPWLAVALAKVAGDGHGRRFFLRLTLGLVALVGLGLSLRVAAAFVYYGFGQVQPINAPGVVGLAMKLLYGLWGKFLEVFALGMAVSLLYVYGVEQGGFAQRWRQVLGWLAIAVASAGLVGCLLWAVQVHRLPIVWGTAWIFLPLAGVTWQLLGQWTLGLCFAFLLLGVLMGPPMLRRWLTITPLRFVGIISYSLYLWHWPILSLLITRGLIDSLASYVRVIMAALLTILLIATSSYVLIERPFLRFRLVAQARDEEAHTGPPACG